MYRLWQKRPSSDMIIRILADALMVSLALLSALAVRYLWLVDAQNGASEQINLREYIQDYRSSVWLLTVICLAVFAASGFYTHGRMYRGRYKALVVAQASSLSYLIFGFLAYLFPRVIALPRGALLLAWLLTAALLIGARLWSMLWKAMIQTENRFLAMQPSSTNAPHVLVIGGAGYIGSALLPKLLERGYRVRLLDLLLFGNEPIASVIDHPQLEIVQADFRQVDKVVEAMRGVDAVIHLGAIVGDPACALDEDLTIEVNLMATRMIAEVAKGSAVNRFIFASTCSVYGASDQLLDERSALNPVSLYARSKIASEKVLKSMTDAYFAPVILRFGTIYGLSGRTRFDLVVNLLSAKALVERVITVFDGDQWRPFVHVDDAALAVFKVLDAPLGLVRDQIFNVGSDEQNFTIQQIGEMIHQIVPVAQLINMGTGADRRNYRVNFSKIRHTLDFVPQRTIEYGIRQVLSAITAGRVKNYQEAQYSNVKFLGEGGAARLTRRENDWAHALLNDQVAVPAANGDMLAEPALQVKVVGG